MMEYSFLYTFQARPVYTHNLHVGYVMVVYSIIAYTFSIKVVVEKGYERNGTGHLQLRSLTMIPSPTDSYSGQLSLDSGFMRPQYILSHLYPLLSCLYPAPVRRDGTICGQIILP